MKSHKIAAAVIAALNLFFFFSGIAFSDEKPVDETEIPIYSGLQFIENFNLKKDTPAARYCSNATPAEIKNYYTKLFRKAIAMQEGTSSSVLHRILLDVISPVKWRESKRLIEIYSDHKKTDCNTIVVITQTKKKVEKAAAALEQTKEIEPAVQDRKIEAPASASPERKFAGIGFFSNTLNFSAGPTLILWPLENLALQGYYGAGTFTSYQARVFYRLNISPMINPYVGAGWIHAEKEATVIGVKTKISGGNFDVFGGAEVPLYKGLFLYTEAAGTPLKLEKDVTNGARTAKATVDYSAVTVSAGLVYYIW